MSIEDIKNRILRYFPDMQVYDISDKVEKKGWEYVDIIDNFLSISDCLESLYKKDLSCLGKTLEWHKDSLPGFTPEGFQYILKYYLLYSLDNPSSDVADYVVFHLSGIDKEKRYWKDRYNILSKDQRSSIAEFLNHMKGMDDFKVFMNTIDKGIANWVEK